MLSYESIMSIDTALNQLYILIYSFEFRIIGIVKGNLNSCQYMNKVIFKICTFNWKEIKKVYQVIHIEHGDSHSQFR